MGKPKFEIGQVVIEYGTTQRTILRRLHDVHDGWIYDVGDGIRWRFEEVLSPVLDGENERHADCTGGNVKAFNKECDCSDRYSISISDEAICELCGRGFCSTKCGWIEGHTTRDGKPCQGRWKTVFVKQVF